MVYAGHNNVHFGLLPPVCADKIEYKLMVRNLIANS